MATMRVVQVSRPNGPFEVVERQIADAKAKGLIACASRKEIDAVLDVDVAGWQFPQAVEVVWAAPDDVVVGGFPWQDVQVTFASYVPFRWAVALTVVPV